VTPFPKGTKVKMQISHAGSNFIAIGKVAYSRPNSGMGIAFITIEPKSQDVLDLWLTKRADTDRQLQLDIGTCRPILNRDVSNFFKGSYGHYRLSIHTPLAFDFSR
jgi:hypothetical protein